MPGKMICLCGIDAAGKQTQSKLLAQRLNAKLFSFPAYEEPFGDLIRAHLKGDWSARVTSLNPLLDTRKLDAMAFQAIQLANKAALAGEIKKAVSVGNVVLDRYWPSACPLCQRE